MVEGVAIRRGRSRTASDAILRRWLPFLVLAAWNGAFAFAHDPSRHELQALLIARASSGPLSLLRNLAHEGHPGLWHLLLLAALSLYDHTLVLNLLQALVATAILALIWLASPFGTGEKALLSLGYYLAFEYAIPAPGYGLGVALFLAAVACRRSAWAWLMLGLMANVGIHFMALAAIFGALLLYQGQRSRPGIALASALAALAVVTAYPAADTIVATQAPGAGLRALLSLARLSSALLPMAMPWPFGFRWSEACPGCGGLAPLVLGAAVLVLGTLSLRERPALLAAFLASAAALFLVGAAIYLGYDRHYGLLFVVLVGLNWMAREETPRRRASAVFLGWITVSAAVGLWAAYAYFPAHGSNGRAAAEWLASHAEDNAVVAVYPGWMGISIAAYLGKPVYNLQARRYQSYVVWNYAADARPTGDDLGTWLEAAPRTGPLYFVSDADPAASTLDESEIARLEAVGVELTEVARFARGGEGYALYRVRFKNG